MRKGEQAIALAQKTGGEQRIEDLPVAHQLALLAERGEHRMLNRMTEHCSEAEKVGPLGSKGEQASREALVPQRMKVVRQCELRSFGQDETLTRWGELVALHPSTKQLHGEERVSSGALDDGRGEFAG